MYYVKNALVQLLDGFSFVVGRKDAQLLYSWEDNESPIVLTDFDRSIHQDMGGPVKIRKDAILFIAYTEDQEANRFSQEIDDKWKKIVQETGVKDDGGLDWFTDGQNTYIGSEEWMVSEDPRVAQLLLEVQDLEDKLEAHLRGERYASR